MLGCASVNQFQPFVMSMHGGGGDAVETASRLLPVNVGTLWQNALKKPFLFPESLHSFFSVPQGKNEITRHLGT